MKSPGPAIDPLLTYAPTAWAVIILLIVLSIMGAGLTWAIIYSARLPIPTQLIVTLSLLVLALLGLYALFGDARSELVPLASAAIGALVAALAGLPGKERVVRLKDSTPPPSDPKYDDLPITEEIPIIPEQDDEDKKM